MVNEEAGGIPGGELVFGKREDFVDGLLVLLRVLHLRRHQHDLWLDPSHGCSLVDQVEIGSHTGVVVLLHLLELKVGTVEANEEESGACQEQRT